MKKILSVLLALCMVLSCVPMPVLAEETQHDIVVTEPTVPETTEATEPIVPETTEATEPAAVCTCESDDATWHAPFCDLFVMPENPACYCAEKCTVDTVNEWCEVCYFDLEACGGSEENTGSPFNVEKNAPVIHSVSVDKKQVSAGESVTVTMEVTDESELDQVSVTFDSPNEGVANMIQVTLSQGEDGLYHGTLTTNDSFASGTYYAYYIVAEDVHGNRNQINRDESVCFELISDRTENNAPVIKGVSLDKTQVKIGESVTVTMDVEDESALAQVYVSFEMPFAGVTKRVDVSLSKVEDSLYRGVLTTDDTYPCGNYYAYYIVAEDIYGNREQINQDRSVAFNVVIGGVETNAPVINSVKLDKTQIVAGETITVTADISDESDLSDVQVFFDTPLAGSFNDILVHLTQEEDGLYRGTLVTDETLPNGDYYLDACVAIDIHGNRTQINKKMASFKLSGGYADITAPVINSVAVNKNVVAAGETITVTADIADESNLSDVQVFFDTPLAGSFNDILVHLTLKEDGLYRGTFTTDETLPNGDYYLDACVAIDIHGNRTQVNKKMDSFQLTGGHTEVNAPVVNSVILDKTKVSAGETVTVTADISDESDMSDVQVFIDTPISSSFADILVHLTLEEDGLYRGTVTMNETFPNGSYDLDTCVAIDIHGNRTQVRVEAVSFEFGVSKIETNAPVIHSISLDKTQVLTGESVTVTMDVTDESELDEVYVEFDTPHAGVVKRVHVELTEGEDGLYRGTLTTDESYPYGTYYAYYVVVEDVLGNREQINRDTSLAFELIAEDPNANIYTVTWNIDGVFYAETEVKAGEAITAPDYTAPEGYTFSGWDVPETMPAEDIELDATLTANKYKVTWIVDDTETEAEYAYGATIVAPEDPSKTGNRCVSYSFNMWEGFTEGMTMPAEDLEFTAVFDVAERHIDRNRDHICDRKCGKTDIGEHADSATDKDHRCDYGCKAILEACTDKDGDGNHNCDICRKKNVTAHTYTEATCTKPATCTECGAKHGKLKSHTWNDGKVLKKPTCTKPGVMGFKCKDCDKSHIEMIKPEGHDWDNGKVTRKASCTKDGVKTYTCESCRAIKTVKIKAVGHDYHNGVCRNCRDKKFHDNGFYGWWHPWWK